MEAVIHHGGIGTLAQALAAGVPQLVLASGFDRPDNATRLQRLGVAEHLPPSCWKPAAAVEALRRLLESPDVRERCIATRERFLKGCSDAALSEAIQQVITSAGVDWLGGTAANPKSLP
jgi:UDP:flavonoid glycosyltransferase YjiC (YdhE family)